MYGSHQPGYHKIVIFDLSSIAKNILEDEWFGSVVFRETLLQLEDLKNYCLLLFALTWLEQNTVLRGIT